MKTRILSSYEITRTVKGGALAVTLTDSEDPRRIGSETFLEFSFFVKPGCKVVFDNRFRLRPVEW